MTCNFVSYLILKGKYLLTERLLTNMFFLFLLCVCVNKVFTSAKNVTNPEEAEKCWIENEAVYLFYMCRTCCVQLLIKQFREFKGT